MATPWETATPEWRLAMEAVRAGGRRITSIRGDMERGRRLELSLKSDRTVVSEADLQSGDCIRRMIKQQFPGDAIDVEDLGQLGSGPRNWLVDPLDGSASFARGHMYPTVGVGFCNEGEVIVSAIHHPFEQITYMGGQGACASVEGVTSYWKNLAVSKRPLEGGVAFIDALFNEKTVERKTAFIKKLTELAGGNLGVRMTGSNIDQQRHVAAGSAELTLIDAVGGPWDVLIGAHLITEAGGMMLGLDGNPVTLSTQVAIGGPKHVIDIVMESFQDCYRGYSGFR